MIDISTNTLITILAVLMVGSSVVLLGRMRLVSFLRVFAFQSLVLVCIALTVALNSHEAVHLYIVALLTLGIKVIFTPHLLLRIAKKSGVVQRLQSYMRPTPSLALGMVIAATTIWFTKIALPDFGQNGWIATAALAVILLGFLMLIIRRDMYSQLIAFLVMENGIFTFGLSLTGGMPLMVELGIFLDVTVGVILMAALSYNAQTHYESVDTKSLDSLIE